ncbi:MAG TPA: branched-chain amino acid ABC transporter permease [Actinomycetota bacterium]|nr:branched-chain amino acid ABC transporter permease [Actinomycetota bacterium]
MRVKVPQRPLFRHLLFAALAAAVFLTYTAKTDAFTAYKLAGVAFFLVAIAGLNLLTGLSGQLSLGHGALMAIGAYTTALVLRNRAHFPIAAAIILAVVVTAAVGAFVGIAAARLRGPYLAGATLALAVGLPPLTTKYAGFFGGDQGISVRPLAPPAIGSTFAPEQWLAWISIIAALITLVLLANLQRSRFGRAFKCVRDNEIAAALSGINVARTQVFAFVVSAACAGLAGSLLAFYAGLTAPAGFSIVLSLQLLTAIVIGGLGSMTGSVLGAFALVYIPSWSDSLTSHFNLHSAVSDNIPAALYGGVLIIAMLLFPGGIAGGLRKLKAMLIRHLKGGRLHGASPEVLGAGSASVARAGKEEG